jgi:hypothetical protein
MLANLDLRVNILVCSSQRSDEIDFRQHNYLFCKVVADLA